MSLCVLQTNFTLYHMIVKQIISWFLLSFPYLMVTIIPNTKHNDINNHTSIHIIVIFTTHNHHCHYMISPDVQEHHYPLHHHHSHHHYVSSTIPEMYLWWSLKVKGCWPLPEHEHGGHIIISVSPILYIFFKYWTEDCLLFDSISQDSLQAMMIYCPFPYMSFIHLHIFFLGYCYFVF